MTILYRPIRSTLEESISEMKSFKSFSDLFNSLINAKLLNKDKISIRPYDLSFDSRTWWNETCFLCYEGNVLGFVGTRSI